MSEHFIKNIEIRNFKCFEDFKAEGFGRVNLIGGKNNVGKTAFMEALYLSRGGECNNTLGKVFSSLIKILNLRSKILQENDFDNIFSYLDNISFFIKSNQGLLNFQALTEYTENDTIYFENFISIQGIKFTNKNYPRTKELLMKNFIPSDSINNKTMELIYDEIKEQRKRELLNSYILNFDNNLLEFDFIKDIPKLYEKNIQKFSDIYEFGHGIKRYISIVGAILINKDGYLFLDEIENGIHYSNLDKLWEVILKTSKEENVQVFATTHSKECIESYARVAKKLKDKEITFIELGRDDDNKITSIVYEYDEIINQVEQHQDIRGW